jgi:hypothetical protein
MWNSIASAASPPYPKLAFPLPATNLPLCTSPKVRWNKGDPAAHTQLRPEFFQKDRPSPVPQQAVADVRDSQSRFLEYTCFVPICQAPTADRKHRRAHLTQPHSSPQYSPSPLRGRHCSHARAICPARSNWRRVRRPIARQSVRHLGQ